MQKMISKLRIRMNVFKHIIASVYSVNARSFELSKLLVLIILISVVSSKGDNNENPEIIDLPPCDSALVLDDSSPIHEI
jgi:hypothetical protein